MLNYRKNDNRIVDAEDGQVIAHGGESATPEQMQALVDAYNAVGPFSQEEILTIFEVGLRALRVRLPQYAEAMDVSDDEMERIYRKMSRFMSAGGGDASQAD